MEPRRGEIYYVDLGQPRGTELAFERPVLILSIDSVNRDHLVTVVVPGTKAANVKRDFVADFRVPPSASGLKLETVFRCNQITAVDARKFPPTPRLVVCRRNT